MAWLDPTDCGAGFTRFHKVGRLASIAQRSLIFKHMCARDLVDRQRNPLPGAPTFPIVSVSSVLSISNHTFPGTRLELDHGVPATADRCGRGRSVPYCSGPVTREGVMLCIPGLDIEVANECSSIRSSMMGLVTTPLFSSTLPSFMVEEDSVDRILLP